MNDDKVLRDNKGYCHLMRLIDGKWIELTEGLTCTCVYSEDDGDWSWRDEDEDWHEVLAEKEEPENEKLFIDAKGYFHLMRLIDGEWVDVTKCKYIRRSEGGSYVYWIIEDNKAYDHLLREADGKWTELTKGLKCRGIHIHKNGDWEWEDEDGDWHKVQAKKEEPEKIWRDKDGWYHVTRLDIPAYAIELPEGAKWYDDINENEYLEYVLEYILQAKQNLR